jgi:uncharacterized protein
MRGLPLLFAALLAVAPLPAAARELVVAEAALQPAEVLGVEALPVGDMAAIVLKVGDDTLPVFTGLYEGAAIERARRGVAPPRPQTHELFADVLARQGLVLKRVVIDELRDDGNFMAAMELQRRGEALSRIDARPSDAIALALRLGAPIVVAEQVVKKALAEAEAESDAPPIRL